MALDATVAGTNSNSYVTQAEATAYFANHPFASAWVYSESKLIYAATMLDAYVSWSGYKTTPTQARQWPRVLGDLVRTNGYPPSYDTGMTFLGAGILDMVVPTEIKAAQMELALYFTQNTSVLPEGVSINRLDIGPIRIDQNGFKAGQQDALPPLVSLIIQKYGKTRATGTPVFQPTVTR